MWFQSGTFFFFFSFFVKMILIGCSFRTSVFRSIFLSHLLGFKVLVLRFLLFQASRTSITSEVCSSSFLEESKFVFVNDFVIVSSVVTDNILERIFSNFGLIPLCQ